MLTETSVPIPPLRSDMALAEARLTAAWPQVIRRRYAEVLEREIVKGCEGVIWSEPVPLEPPFGSLAGSQIKAAATPPPTGGKRVRLWISPEREFEWNRAELFVKLLSAVRQRIVFELIGNAGGIACHLLFHDDDEAIIRAAFQGIHEDCAFSDTAFSIPPDIPVQVSEFYPPPPYSDLLSCYEEIESTPFETLLVALAAIPHDEGNPTFGFYQCLFQPVHPLHDWHANIEQIVNLRYFMEMQDALMLTRRQVQQPPSHDLRQSSLNVVTKAHNDKPFFATVVRVGVYGQRESLGALETFLRLFRHGGRGLLTVAPDDFKASLSEDSIRNMVREGVSHRYGFLLNSQELAGLVHLIPSAVLEREDIPFETLEALIPSELVEGSSPDNQTFIGVCRSQGNNIPVFIPQRIRKRSTHIIGASRVGKSTIMIRMIHDDISKGTGVALIDPTGDTWKDMVAFLHPKHHEKVIYFNPGDPVYVPLWNPLHVESGVPVNYIVEVFLNILRRVSKDWGDRLHHQLRQGLLGLLSIPGRQATVMDLHHLLRQGSSESKALRQRIIASATNETVRHFWKAKGDIDREFNKGDMLAPKNKLSKLLFSDHMQLMFKQAENAFDFRKIMDEGRILIIDLSDIGADSQSIVGSFMLHQFMAIAQGRHATEKTKRIPFSIYADESHRIVEGDAIESLITQAAKYNIYLTLAHQMLSQFDDRKVDALSTVGTSIIGRVDKHDSEFLAKDLRDKVQPKELLELPDYQFIARIQHDIVRMTTVDFDWENAYHTEHIDRVKQHSFRKYYKSADDLRRELYESEGVVPVYDDQSIREEDLSFDVF